MISNDFLQFSRKTLLGKARIAYLGKDYHTCANLLAMAIKKGERNPDFIYQSACCFALAKEKTNAFAYLQKAIEAGFVNIELLRKDPDLKLLRISKSWNKIINLARVARKIFVESINGDLYKLYREDQSDRMEARVDFNALLRRDRVRYAKVKKLLHSGCLSNALDFYHAAVILQHGEKPRDYEMAHRLARRALKLNGELREAKWLYAAARDRYLWSVGKPQWYGTQFTLNVLGKWSITPIDEAAVTDVERRNLGVLTLAQTKRLLKLMNKDLIEKKDPPSIIHSFLDAVLEATL